MSAQSRLTDRLWSPLRATRRWRGSAKEAVKSMIATLVRRRPHTAYRLASYIDHVATGTLRRRAQHSVALKLPTAQPVKPRASVEELLGSAASQLNHADVLHLLARAGLVREPMLHRYLTRLFVGRRLDVMEQVVSRAAMGFGDVRLFHRLKLQQYKGLTAASAEVIKADYNRLRGNPLFHDAAVNLAIDFFVRRGDAEELATFLGGVPCAEFARVAPATFLGCFRLLEQAGQAAAYEPWREAFLVPLSDEQSLYHLEMMPPSAPLKVQAQTGWRAILAEFARAYSAPDAEDRALLNDRVLAPLRSLPNGALDFMNIRFDDAHRQELFNRIEGALKEQRPMSLVRLGDGEGYGYAVPDITGIGREQFVDDNAIRERMWWGATISPADRERVTDQFRAAVAGADIIGIPSIYRLIRDRSTPFSRYGETGGQRGLAVVLGELGRAIPTDRLLTEERCHQLLFQRQSLELLARLAERVVLVSCWRKDQVALSARDLREVVIPPHTKVASLTGHASGASLATTFEAQVAEMADHCAPGTLVLVGAGFIGKIFIGEARKRGAVALDVGAVLDYLAGYKTRSLADLG